MRARKSLTLTNAEAWTGNCTLRQPVFSEPVLVASTTTKKANPPKGGDAKLRVYRWLWGRSLLTAPWPPSHRMSYHISNGWWVASISGQVAWHMHSLTALIQRPALRPGNLISTDKDAYRAIGFWLQVVLLPVILLVCLSQSYKYTQTQTTRAPANNGISSIPQGTRRAFVWHNLTWNNFTWEKVALDISGSSETQSIAPPLSADVD